MGLLGALFGAGVEIATRNRVTKNSQSAVEKYNHVLIETGFKPTKEFRDGGFVIGLDEENKKFVCSLFEARIYNYDEFLGIKVCEDCQNSRFGESKYCVVFDWSRPQTSLSSFSIPALEYCTMMTVEFSISGYKKNKAPRLILLFPGFYSHSSDEYQEALKSVNIIINLAEALV